MNRSFAAALALTTIALATLALATFAAPPALARGISQTVHHGDLDLATEAGARALLERIDEAARDVCGDYGGLISASQRGVIRRCVTQATEAAVAELNHPTVTAVHLGRAPATLIAGH